MSLLLKNKKILISPLDWGLGHTTRIIPIIKALQDEEALVYIACNEIQKTLLDQEINNFEHIQFDGYNISYSEAFFNLKITSQIPKILLKIKSENKALETLQKKYKFDAIISDNRFGFYHKETPSFYLTHQINIQSPFGSEILKKLHLKFIDKFSGTFIPDNQDGEVSLAGKLSHPTSGDNQHYIGTLTRFNQEATSTFSHYKYLAIISGPEPHRTSFEKIILNKFKQLDSACAIIGGNINGNSEQIENITYYNHLPSKNFQEVVANSENIIIRSGYSSIMDFQVLQKPIITIPTPGQTEQEYLSKYLLNSFDIPSFSQNQIEKEDLSLIKFNKLPFSSQSKNLNFLIEKLATHI